MGVAAAAVGAHLARTHLVPGLGHVEHQAAAIEGLEGERRVGRHLGQEAGVRVALGVGALVFPVARLAVLRGVEGVEAGLRDLDDLPLRGEDVEQMFDNVASGEPIYPLDVIMREGSPSV